MGIIYNILYFHGKTNLFYSASFYNFYLKIYKIFKLLFVNIKC